MRQGQTGRNAYRFTVRQLESLIRLSEAMARMHCDEEIKPSYVREVCRLLKQSNINIIKGDIEMEQNQEAINVERQQARDQENANIQANNGFTNGANNNLFVSHLLFDTFQDMEKEQRQQSQPKSTKVIVEEPAKAQKVKITYDEFTKLTQLIVYTIRQFEKESGMESVSQADIVNRLIQQIEVEDNINGTSMERAVETSKKIANVIQHLITKENVLIVTQDSKNKNERLLCLNVNTDEANLR